MALHESSIEEQPPHKRARSHGGSFLNTFDFQPNASSPQRQEFISAQQTNSPMRESTTFSPTPIGGSRSPMHCGRPQSQGNRSTSSSISGLLSPFDRCMNNINNCEERTNPPTNIYNSHDNLNETEYTIVENSRYSPSQTPQHLMQNQLVNGMPQSRISSPLNRIPNRQPTLYTTNEPNHIIGGQYTTVSNYFNDSPAMQDPNYRVRQPIRTQNISYNTAPASVGGFSNKQRMSNEEIGRQNGIIQNNDAQLAGHSDARQIRLLTAQLILLLHAYKCGQRDRLAQQTNGANSSIQPCQVQQCSIMKNILHHALNCTQGDLCEIQHCITSKKLVRHWRLCSYSDCPICSPVKAAASQYCTLNPAPLTTTRSCRDWQKFISPEVRSNLIIKIVASIFPQHFESNQKDVRMQRLIHFARKLEAEIFDASSDQENYFFLLAERVYNVRKDIEVRRSQFVNSISSEPKPSSSNSSSSSTVRVPYNPDTMAGEEGPPNRIAPSALSQINEQSIERYIKSEPIDNFKIEPKYEHMENNEVETKTHIPSVHIKKEKIESKIPSEDHRFEIKDKILCNVIETILLLDDSIPFRQPVDPVLLNIPDYPDIIKNPMDLSTIKERLENLYYETPWDFIDDMWLMFANAWTYNKKTSKIYKMCSRLYEQFNQLMNPVMMSMGYCCGERRVFLPQVLFCYGNQLCSQIARDSQYYCFTNDNPISNLNNDKYTICSRCFESAKDEVIQIGDDPTGALQNIAKSRFQVLKNDHQEMEPFVQCTQCNRKLHQICVLHHESIHTEPFVCSNCKKVKSINKRFNACRLSTNKLGQWIENRVNSHLSKLGYHDMVGTIHVRVLGSFDKQCEIKPRMKKYFDGKMPNSFPFRSKAIFAFQEQDGHDIVFFGLHVQEYDEKAPGPNSRRVYISYLDSVYFFKPKQIRTEIYHEILIGYLDWAKRQGYQWGHIWACPPSEGDDYIFYCHPPDQKVPKQKRLIDWYRRMLDKAVLDRVVVEYHDIMRDAIENRVETLADIPYFDGDFWPNVFEESIKELDEEKQESVVVKEMPSGSSTTDEGMIVDSEDDEISITTAKRCNTQKKRNQMAKNKSQRKNAAKKLPINCSSDLTSKVFATMDKHKEVFFVIRLSDVTFSTNEKIEIVDVDPLLTSDLMDGRDAFLNFSRERHLEFSTLRRTKFSTMMFLFEIHNLGSDRFVYSCNTCKNQVSVGYHCTVCEDFDLCTTCYQKGSHEHPMERLSAAIDIVSSSKNANKAIESDASQADPQQLRQQSIDRCIDSLLHALNCRNANCVIHAGCAKMKLVIQHIKQCTLKPPGCQICRQINMLSYHHARLCNDKDCLFPFCTTLKQKMQKQRLLNNQLERRRMLTTMQRNMPQPPSMTPPSHHEYSPSYAKIIASPNNNGKPTTRMPLGATMADRMQMLNQERSMYGMRATPTIIRRCPQGMTAQYMRPHSDYIVRTPYFERPQMVRYIDPSSEMMWRRQYSEDPSYYHQMVKMQPSDRNQQQPQQFDQRMQQGKGR